MDFNDTPEEAAFRAEARAFLDIHVKKKTAGNRSYRSREMSPEDVAASKAWQAKKAAAGFAGILWPKEYGGRGGTPMQHIIFQQEEEKYVVPPSVFNVGVGMVMPTIMSFGTPDQLARYPKPGLHGDEVWCQLFSEPSAGSDLAGVRTRAVKDGGDWIINGHKIWNSNAHFADFGVLVARHDPTLPKHKGLTFFIVDMKSPGMDIHRIKQISGTSNFCEVFMNDVRIPDANRLGPVGAGWKVAMTLLANERFTVGMSEGPDFEDMFELVKSIELDGKPAIEDSAVREKLVDWYVKEQGLKLTRFRSLTALSRGKSPGPENSIGKLVSAPKLQDMAAYGIDLMGQTGAVMNPELAPMNAWFQEALLYSPSKRIAGGTDEIMRNIVAERVLGLPGDVRVDKDVPFNQIPTSRR